VGTISNDIEVSKEMKNLHKMTDGQLDAHCNRTRKKAQKVLKQVQTVLRKCRMNEELRNPDVVWNQLKTPPPVPVTQEHRDTADEILRRAMMGMKPAKSLKKKK